MSRYAILVSKYPTEERPNEYGFVHSRARAYIASNHEVDIYVTSEKEFSYCYESVPVFCGSVSFIKKSIKKKHYKAILVHFLDKEKIEILEDQVCFIWVHGFEALSWKRRLFNINLRLPLNIIKNTKQLNSFRNYAKFHPQSKFIFVSEWMYQITCKDIGYKIENYEIIHNYIDSEIFSFKEKKAEARKQFLLVRSFANRKYANDISEKIIEKLSEKTYFNELKFTIYGDGKLFTKVTRKIKNYSNVEIHKKFISQKAIAKLHKNNGIFLCPTRQDAQGVSMCEAMSSGLIPLTSQNSAIPEFVNDQKEGYLCDNNDIDTFIAAYEKLYYNEELFLEISSNTSKHIQEKCSYNNTILKEIQLIEEK